MGYGSVLLPAPQGLEYYVCAWRTSSRRSSSPHVSPRLGRNYAETSERWWTSLSDPIVCGSRRGGSGGFGCEVDLRSISGRPSVAFSKRRLGSRRRRTVSQCEPC